MQAETCAKVVFNRYCLGGDNADNLAHLPTAPPVQTAADGEEEFTFEEGGKVIRLRARDGITVAVSREERPGGWINYTAWKVKIVRLYGRGTDLSSFPPYAGSRSSRLNAINAGRGHAEFEWPLEEFTIKLVWDHPDYIQLQYLLAPQLDAGIDASEGL
ncbi:MAG TPA: hypothetical protein DD979_10285 [Gammaproteobacteria bacterium]|nr:hypothetical protein [Gammaproteobacteria bacterium]